MRYTNYLEKKNFLRQFNINIYHIDMNLRHVNICALLKSQHNKNILIKNYANYSSILFLNDSDIIDNLTIYETNNETNNMNNFNLLYFYGALFLIFFCIISVVVNIKILVSACWIRQSISPTLHISLSLAGADAFTAITLGAGLIMNSFIPYGLGIKLSGVSCLLLGLEAVRLGGVLITMGHLVTLAVNHYLGILRPLHYLSIMTHKIITTFIVILWILPLCFFITYFSLVKNEGFQSLNCQTNTFLFKKKFRTMFSSLFFGPFIFMVCIYVHIFYIVKKHQASRLRFSQAGSSFRRNEITDTQRHTSQQLARNVKAVYTTLYILGSFVVGWMPATFLFVLVCEDCVLKFDIFTGNTKFIIYNASNCLIILKTLVNPIIYAARMHEIQLATRRMHAKFCGFLRLKNVSKERNVEVLPSSEEQSNRHLGIGRLMSVNGKRPRSYKYTYTGVRKNPQNCGAPYK